MSVFNLFMYNVEKWPNILLKCINFKKILKIGMAVF